MFPYPCSYRHKVVIFLGLHISPNATLWSLTALCHIVAHLAFIYSCFINDPLFSETL